MFDAKLKDLFRSYFIRILTEHIYEWESSFKG